MNKIIESTLKEDSQQRRENLKAVKELGYLEYNKKFGKWENQILLSESKIIIIIC